MLLKHRICLFDFLHAYYFHLCIPFHLYQCTFVTSNKYYLLIYLILKDLKLVHTTEVEHRQFMRMIIACCPSGITVLNDGI